jgi:hypothetical protein
VGLPERRIPDVVQSVDVRRDVSKPSGGDFYHGPPHHYYGGGLGLVALIVVLVLPFPLFCNDSSDFDEMTDPSPLRKRLLEADAATSVRDNDEIDIAGCATIAYSSENPAHPVEHLLDRRSGHATQLLPFYDAQAVSLFGAFESVVYDLTG